MVLHAKPFRAPPLQVPAAPIVVPLQVGHGRFWPTPRNTFDKLSTLVVELPVPTSAVPTSSLWMMLFTHVGLPPAFVASGGAKCTWQVPAPLAPYAYLPQPLLRTDRQGKGVRSFAIGCGEARQPKQQSSVIRISGSRSTLEMRVARLEQHLKMG